MPYNTVIIDVPAILKRADVRPGNTIADLGTGREGRMALSAGKIIGQSGVAYAVDVVKAILPAVESKALMLGINNVKTIWSDLEIYGATKAIIDNSLDVGFLVTTLFQSNKRAEIMNESYRMVRPGGKLVVVDWKPGSNAPLGPEESRRVHPAEIKQTASELGLKLIDEFDAGEYHWGLIFVK